MLKPEMLNQGGDLCGAWCCPTLLLGVKRLSSYVIQSVGLCALPYTQPLHRRTGPRFCQVASASYYTTVVGQFVTAS
jgi:hypothetical protein